MFEELKKKSIKARKDKSPEASLLVTLLSEITMRAKNDGNREPNEEDVTKTVQKFMKSALETRDLLDQRGQDTSESEMEITVLEQYLPQMLSEVDTIKAVGIAFCDVEANGMQDMGKVMGELKKKYGSTIDMKLAAQIFKDQTQWEGWKK